MEYYKTLRLKHYFKAKNILCEHLAKNTPLSLFLLLLFFFFFIFRNEQIIWFFAALKKGFLPKICNTASSCPFILNLLRVVIR